MATTIRRTRMRALIFLAALSFIAIAPLLRIASALVYEPRAECSGTCTFAHPAVAAAAAATAAAQMGGSLSPPPPLLPPCRGHVVFRYDYGSGGYGDCIKGLVAVAQVAHALGCPFSADFSRHPFQLALPLSADLAPPPRYALIDEGDALFVHMGDWTTGPHRLRARDAFFARVAVRDATLRDQGVVVVANIPHSRELAAATNASAAGLVAFARGVYAAFYTHVVDGAKLGTLWPPAQPHAVAPFRVGVHVRMGDMFIPNATVVGDNRNPDADALLAALQLVGVRTRELAGGRPVVVFACADTAAAREMVRSALAPLDVITALVAPVHIGYAATFAERALVEETRSVAREHYSLATADVIFVASNSGFSKTACAIAGALKATARCFLRAGATWVPLEPGEGVL